MSKEEKQKWIDLARWIIERSQDIDSKIMNEQEHLCPGLG